MCIRDSIGTGIAGFGPGVIDWSFEGVGGIIASWFISPFVSGAIAAIIYLIVKFGILKRENSFKWGLFLVPIFFVSSSIPLSFIMQM